jgi:hypothetical protein
VRASDAEAVLLGDWSLDDFERSPMYPEYLDRCRDFRSGYVAEK